MKKIMIAAFAIVMSGVANASLNKDSTEAEFRAVADAVLACTNMNQAARLAYDENLWASSTGKSLAGFRAEYDERLAAKIGITGHGPGWALKSWPKTAEAVCAAIRATERVPYLYATAKKLGSEMLPSYVAKEGGMEVAVKVLAEMVARRDDYYIPYDIAQLEQVKKCIQNGAERAVRKWLRRQGKSFVTKDGVNPCAEKMTALNAALNAARLDGLNEWLADIGIDARVDDAALPSAAEAEALRTAVLDGDKDLTCAIKRVLYLCLGVDGYNAFVREYNGEK